MSTGYLLLEVKRALRASRFLIFTVAFPILIDRLLTDRTGIVIAHRLSQAAACDRIVVMDGGRVIETGTHDELRTADGRYARLWAAWQAGQRVSADR